MLFRLPVVLSLVFVLSSCSVMPGMHVDRGDLEKMDYRERDSDGDGYDASKYIKFTSITSDVAAAEFRAPSAFPVELLSVQPPTYRIGVNDSIQLIVWNHPEISSPLGQMTSNAGGDNNSRLVNEDGYVFLPFVGELQINGLSIREARNLIGTKLSRYIQNPQVDIVVTAHDSQMVSVIGEVSNPRVVPIETKPINLLDAIAAAGGFTGAAKQNSVKLTRAGAIYTINFVEAARVGIDLSKILLLANDQIFVPDNYDDKVYMLGEVAPGPVPLGLRGLTLMQALGEVGGVNPVTSDASEIFVFRKAIDNDQYMANVFHLNASSPLAMVTADEFTLYPKDIIFVGPLDVSRFNRIISQIFPSFGLYRSLEQLRLDLGGS